MPPLDPVAVLLAYGYAVIAGGLVVPRVMGVVKPSYAPHGPWHRAAFGLVERVVVVTAAVLLSVELAAGWLVLKAASSWRGWSEQPGVYNRFVIGTAVSMSYAAGGGALAWGWALESTWLMAGGVLGPLLLSALVASYYPDAPNRWTRLWRASVYEGEESSATPPADP